MKKWLLLSVTLLLTASAARASAAPTLKANPNPVVVPAGQTQGATTLTWNTEGAEGYVWASVDGGEETQLTEAGAAEGSLEVTVELGKTYAFKLYTGDKENLVASVTVTVSVQQAVPPPTQLPARPKPRPVLHETVQSCAQAPSLPRSTAEIHASLTPHYFFNPNYLTPTFPSILTNWGSIV